MSNETDARIVIDRLLRGADWDIEDKAQVSTEEAAADGRTDYILQDSHGQSLVVIQSERHRESGNIAVHTRCSVTRSLRSRLQR
jgi:predicted type IV restriction endonuclease